MIPLASHAAPRLPMSNFRLPRLGDCPAPKTALSLLHAESCARSRTGVSFRKHEGAQPPSFSALGPMHRVIARTLLFSLLAVLFSPLAAASSMSISHPHCMRKPTPAPAPEMSGCHHHHGAAAPQQVSPQNADSETSDHILGPHDCCQDHECCRSMARSQSAHTPLRSAHSELNQVTEFFSVLDTQADSFDPVSNPPGRAPPLL
jgi:hypothetical protein